MRVPGMKNATLALLLSCTAPISLLAATRTITGIVSDTTCGANHRTADAAACARDCMKKGAEYALVVNGDVYTVKAATAQKTQLARHVGKTVVVRGDLDGMTITATDVSTAKKIKKH